LKGDSFVRDVSQPPPRSAASIWESGPRACCSG
jgi:hypothetical protein